MSRIVVAYGFTATEVVKKIMGNAKYIPNDSLADSIESEGLSVYFAPHGSTPLDLVDDLEHHSDDSLAARIDAVVTCVDGSTLMKDLHEALDLAEIDPESMFDTKFSTLLVNQIEYANVVVLSHLNLLPSGQQKAVRQFVKGLNPDCLLVDASATIAFPVSLFSMEQIHGQPGWIQSLVAAEPARAEPGFQTFLYRAYRPFEPNRFAQFLSDQMDLVLRAKGFAWIASRSEFVSLVDICGQSCEISPDGSCNAEIENVSPLEASWRPDVELGDRRQEIVFQGFDFQTEAFVAGLNACLLSDQEWQLGPNEWVLWDDPLPNWEVRSHAHEHTDEHEHAHDHVHGEHCSHDHHHGEVHEHHEHHADNHSESNDAETHDLISPEELKYKIRTQGVTLQGLWELADRYESELCYFQAVPLYQRLLMQEQDPHNRQKAIYSAGNSLKLCGEFERALKYFEAVLPANGAKTSSVWENKSALDLSAMLRNADNFMDAKKVLDRIQIESLDTHCKADYRKEIGLVQAKLLQDRMRAKPQ